jgi:rare lipoprotein A
MYFKSLFGLLLFSTVTIFADSIGDASWYGEKFQGKLTASGEAFNMYGYTTAHRTLPFGTILLVTNLSNQKSVEVRVNDRGPVKKNRIVDLSYQAAKEIGIIEEGVGEVSITVKKKKKFPATTKKIEKSFKSSFLNPYLTDEEEQKVVSKIDTYNQKNIESLECEEYLQKINVANEKQVEEKSVVKVQVAAFSSEANAENFINREKESGFNMQLLNIYSDKKDETLYKVVIVCSSSHMAKTIVASDRYNGAYLIK